MVLIVAHVRDLLHRHLDDLERGAVVELELQPVGEPLEERRALRHLGGDVGLRIGAREHVVERAQRAVEQLMVAFVLGQEIEHLRRGAGDVGALQPPRDRLLQVVAHPLVVERLQSIRREARHIGCHRLGVLGLEQPAVKRACRTELADALHHRRTGKKVRLDEERQPGGDALLVARDDRRVRNEAQAERMVEQRRHREPVGDCADHGCLGDDAHPTEPRLLRFQRLSGDVEHTGEGEQAVRSPFHPPQAGVAQLGFLVFAHCASRNRGLTPIL